MVIIKCKEQKIQDKLKTAVRNMTGKAGEDREGHVIFDIRFQAFQTPAFVIAREITGDNKVEVFAMDDSYYYETSIENGRMAGVNKQAITDELRNRFEALMNPPQGKVANAEFAIVEDPDNPFVKKMEDFFSDEAIPDECSRETVGVYNVEAEPDDCLAEGDDRLAEGNSDTVDARGSEETMSADVEIMPNDCQAEADTETIGLSDDMIPETDSLPAITTEKADEATEPGVTEAKKKEPAAAAKPSKVNYKKEQEAKEKARQEELEKKRASYKPEPYMIYPTAKDVTEDALDARLNVCSKTLAKLIKSLAVDHEEVKDIVMETTWTQTGMEQFLKSTGCMRNGNVFGYENYDDFEKGLVLDYLRMDKQAYLQKRRRERKRPTLMKEKPVTTHTVETCRAYLHSLIDETGNTPYAKDVTEWIENEISKDPDFVAYIMHPQKSQKQLALFVQQYVKDGIYGQWLNNGGVFEPQEAPEVMMDYFMKEEKNPDPATSKPKKSDAASNKSKELPKVEEASATVAPKSVTTEKKAKSTKKAKTSAPVIDENEQMSLLDLFDIA